MVSRDAPRKPLLFLILENMEQTYLMRNGKYRLFKIGKSIDPHKRLKQLRTANPNINALI